LDASEPLQNRQNNALNGRPNLPDKDRRSDAAAGTARQAEQTLTMGRKRPMVSIAFSSF
jgi:hypothetical protein